MDTELHKIDISLEIEPCWKSVPPLVRLSFDGDMAWNSTLESVRIFEHHDLLIPGTHTLEIELYGKSDLDPDQALRIRNLSFGGIKSQRFVWQSVYSPCYPEPWASQQRSQHQELLSQIQATDYLGWNGIWRLEFTSPIFTWIHRIENLGWIYN